MEIGQMPTSYSEWFYTERYEKHKTKEREKNDEKLTRGKENDPSFGQSNYTHLRRHSQRRSGFAGEAEALQPHQQDPAHPMRI